MGEISKDDTEALGILHNKLSCESIADICSKKAQLR